MKKVIIILVVATVVVGSCGQATKKQSETVNAEKVPFDYKTLPAEWAELTEKDEKYVIFEGEGLTIEENTLVYWGNRYNILKSYQIGDTIVINTMAKLSMFSEEEERDFKIFWFDKDNGVAQWTVNDEILGNSGLFVIKKKMSEYPIVIQIFAD